MRALSRQDGRERPFGLDGFELEETIEPKPPLWLEALKAFSCAIVAVALGLGTVIVLGATLLGHWQ